MKTLVTPLLWTSRRGTSEYWLLAASGPVLLGSALLGWQLSWLSASTATFCFLVLAALVARHSRARSFGIADVVTLVRGLGVCFLAGLALQALAGGLARHGVLTMIIMGTLCLMLDGVDGRVARARERPVPSERDSTWRPTPQCWRSSALPSRHSESPAGGCWRSARCDTAMSQRLSSLPALRTPLPYRYSGKVIAVAQAVALLAALTFRLTHGEHWVSTAFLLAALASLCWSFGRSVIWQLRHS